MNTLPYARPARASSVGVAELARDLRGLDAELAARRVAAAEPRLAERDQHAAAQRGLDGALAGPPRARARAAQSPPRTRTTSTACAAARMA